jgi:hypothetical protein
MPAFSGTFSGTVEVQPALVIADKPNHELSLVQVRGRQKSPNAKWNDAIITYSVVMDIADGQGTQRGYFVNAHADGDADFGSFEGVITPASDGIDCEGAWTFTGGTGKYQGITGSGKFSMRLSAKATHTAWNGTYELGAMTSRVMQGPEEAVPGAI